MIKNILFTTTILLLLAAVSPANAQDVKPNGGTNPKTDVKFLNDIEVGFESSTVQTSSKINGPKVDNPAPRSITKKVPATNEDFSIEDASSLQLKYSILLDTEVELIKSLNVFNLIDDWFGTRYRLGGTTKSGVDCSALMQTFFAALYGIALPRTAREQYQFTKRVEKTELQEGDLVFFNTTGGISHVGMYLQNNKFVHASSSGGVTISDLDESYWAKRFVNAGRYEKAEETPLFSLLKS